MKPNNETQTGPRSAFMLVGLVLLAAGTGFLVARGYDPVRSQPVATAEPAPFRFEAFDGPMFDEIEAAASAQAELRRRFPAGSDVGALARLFDVDAPERKAWCETRNASDGQATLFCILAHRPHAALTSMSAVNWSVQVRFEDSSRKIAEISVRKRYF